MRRWGRVGAGSGARRARARAAGRGRRGVSSVDARGCLPRRWWQTPPAVRTCAPTVDSCVTTTHNSTLGNPAAVLGRPRVPRAAAASQTPEPTRSADPLPSMTEPGAAFAWRLTGLRRRADIRPLGLHGAGEAARASRTSGTDSSGGSRATCVGVCGLDGRRSGRPPALRSVTEEGETGGSIRRLVWRPARAGSRGRARTARCVECRRAGGVCHAGGGKHPRQCGPSRRPSTHVSPRPITRHSAIPRRFSAARACRARRPQARRPNRPNPPIRCLSMTEPQYRSGRQAAAAQPARGAPSPPVRRRPAHAD